jgi:subtilisin family serine protease
MRSLKPVIACTLIAALSLAVNGSALAGEPPPLPEPPARTAAFDALTARLTGGGTLPVIVQLRAPFEPEGDLPDVVAVADQRAGIARAQDVVARALAGSNASHLRRYRYLPFLAVRVDAAALDTLRRSPWVESVVEDVPEPVALAESTALVGAATPVTGAWAQGFTGAGQTIAILDTGVDGAHPFLAGKVLAEACFSNGPGFDESVCPNGAATMIGPGAARPCNVNAADPLQQCDHGTHVAGIAAGKAYAGQPGGPFSGVAPDATIIAVQVFTRGSFSFCGTSIPCYATYPSDQVAALEYIYSLRNAYNVAVVNLSLGGGRFYTQAECDSAQSATGRKAAIDLLRAAGIATVAASGNNGYVDSLNAPACISSAVSVGSVGDGSGAAAADVVSFFSNSASFLGLLAPGQWINSSVPSGGFANYQGTSMATPHVAGAWAVLKQAKPAATVNEIFNVLQATGQPVTDSRPGAGSRVKPRLQLNTALNAFVPPVRFSASVSTFEGVLVDFSTTRELVLTNFGVTTATLTPTLSGTGFGYVGGGGFPGAGGTCGATLGRGQSCAVQIAFSPTAPGTVSGSLDIQHPNSLGQLVVSSATLTGVGLEICTRNLLSNASFERPTAAWTQSDSVGGAALPVICIDGSCRASGAGPAGPANGQGWAWFGGYTGAAPPAVTQTLTQTVVIPTGTASLQFNFRISRADAGTGANDRLAVLMDGAPLFSASAAEHTDYAAYRLVRLDLNAFANGGAHTLTFSATTTTAAIVNFNVDEAAICSPAFYPLYFPLVGR